MAATATPERTVRSFVTMPLTELPKRKAPVQEIDLDSANALLDAISEQIEVAGKLVTATASDGEVYPDSKSARAEANKAKRLLSHVLPEGQDAKTRVYKTGEDGFAWAIWMEPTKA